MNANDRVQPANARRVCSECGADLSSRAIGDYCPKCGRIWGVNPKGVDADGVVVEDTPCRKCGYDLRGLSENGFCPECGESALVSLGGDFLHFSDPAWLDKVSSGALIVFWCYLAGIGVGLFTGALSAAASTSGRDAALAAKVIGGFMSLAVQLVALWGMWRLTAPDPSGLGERSYGFARKLVRIAAVVAVSATPLNMAVNTMSSGGIGAAPAILVMVLALAAALLQLAAVFAQFYYLEKLANRAPDDRLASLARTVRVGFLVCIIVIIVGAILAIAVQEALVGACMAAIVGIAMLVLGIMGLVVLYRTGTIVKQQAVIARRLRATAGENEHGRPD